MKILKYDLCTKVNHGTDAEPAWEEILSPVKMGWNESNEEIAKREAYNGEYTIDDDGLDEDSIPASLESRVATLESEAADTKEALEMFLNGVTE